MNGWERYIYIYIHTYTYSWIYIAIKKETLSFMTTWMKFEGICRHEAFAGMRHLQAWGIMLKETKQRKKNTAWYHSYVDLKKILFIYLAVPGFGCGMWILSWGLWDLVPWPEFEPQPPALEVWGLSFWTTREIPICGLLKEKKRLTLRKRVESGCQKLRGWV